MPSKSYVNFGRRAAISRWRFLGSCRRWGRLSRIERFCHAGSNTSTKLRGRADLLSLARSVSEGDHQPTRARKEREAEAYKGSSCPRCCGANEPSWSPSLTLRARNARARPATLLRVAGEASAGLVLRVTRPIVPSVRGRARSVERPVAGDSRFRRVPIGESPLLRDRSRCQG
jgi:hypothetical protein